jgi:hypothetical protein
MPQAEPVPIVEISSSLPGDVPVWVNVSSSFRSAKTKQGKQRQLDKSQAGTCTFTFSNADRKFDPENAAGTLYAFLKPMRRIRLRATWNAVTYPIFDGYIDFIEQGYIPPHEAVATITATDGFKRLQGVELPGVWDTVVGAETYVKAWFRLDEPTDDAQAVQILSDRSGHGYYGVKVGLVHSVDGLLADDPNGAMKNPSTVSAGIGLSEAITPLAPPWALEFIFQAPRYDQGAPGFNTYADVIRPFSGPLDAQGQPGTLDAWTRNASDGVNADMITFAVGVLGAPTSWVRGASPVFDNKRHHIVVVADIGVPMKIYIDGNLSVAAAVGNSQTLTRQGIAFGVSLVETTFDEIRIYEGLVPSAVTISMHNSVITAPWANDTPATRIGRVLDLIGWPAADRALSAVGSPLQATALGGTALDHLLLIEETELGAVYMGPSGAVTYTGRDELITAPFTTSVATFGDGAGEIGYTKLAGYRLSDDTIKNVIRRQREGGAEVVAEDATSKGMYGPKTDSSSGTQETSDAVSFDRANYKLTHLKDPKSYVATMELEPRGNPAVLFPIVLGTVGLNKRITVRRRPQNVGAMIEQETSIQGIEHDLGPKRWTTRYYLDATPTQKYFLFDNTLWGSPDWRFSSA